jgi:hypothetical protein
MLPNARATNFLLLRICLHPLILLAVCFAVLVFQAHAELPEGRADELQLLIDKELARAIKSLIDKEELARGMGLRWPPKPSKMGLNAIEAEIEKKVKQRTVQKFPPALETDVRQMAKKKFRLYKIGEIVNLKTKDGQPVKGHLRENNGSSVLIDAKKCKVASFHQDSIARLDANVSAIRIQGYIAKMMKKIALRRELYRTKIREDVAHEIYTENRYIQVYGRWMTHGEYFDHKYAPLKHRLTQRLEPKAKFKVYWDHDFREFQREWYPKLEAIELKRLMDEERKRRKDSQRSKHRKPDPKPAEEEDDTGDTIWD